MKCPYNEPNVDNILKDHYCMLKKGYCFVVFAFTDNLDNRHQSCDHYKRKQKELKIKEILK